MTSFIIKQKKKVYGSKLYKYISKKIKKTSINYNCCLYILNFVYD